MSTTVPADTRDQIVAAGERLFAERGIHGVSLREINRLAGQSNTGAVQYHFGDREGLVRAIVAKHGRDTEPRRHALLDVYEDAARPDLRALAAALVAPLASKLADPDGGGRAYLRISAELCNRSAPALRFPPLGPDDSMSRWHLLLDRLVPPEAPEGRGNAGAPAVLPTRSPAIRLACVELARRAAAEPRDDDRLFTSHLTDLVTAVLSVPPSTATSRLLDQATAADTAARPRPKESTSVVAAR